MKYNSLLLTLFLCLSTMAYSQTSVNVTLTAVSNGRNHDVTMTQDTKYSATTAYRDEMPLLAPTFPNVTLFADLSYGQMTTVCTSDLVGTKLSFYTNQSTDYTLTFSAQTGDVLWLRDTKTNKEFAMLPSTTYSFSVDASEVSSRAQLNIVANRFEVITPSTPTPTEYTICYIGGWLQITAYPADANATIEVKSEETGDVVETLEVTNRTHQEFNLSKLTRGHYTFEANGTTYTIGVQ